ncbi:MAG: tetratricopeptide repeat protein [Cypionkella sp.]|nr:tetratricopeptide repeat protein [Cypionkella sp.]
MSDIMLTMGKPDEAVAYFKQALAADPTNIDAQRGLGKSLMKAGQPAEAAQVWTAIIAKPEATNDDRVSLCQALVLCNY